jgi:hypothetical protein
LRRNLILTNLVVTQKKATPVCTTILPSSLKPIEFSEFLGFQPGRTLGPDICLDIELILCRNISMVVLVKYEDTSPKLAPNSPAN